MEGVSIVSFVASFLLDSETFRTNSYLWPISYGALRLQVKLSSGGISGLPLHPPSPDTRNLLLFLSF